jgi:hypothetical protein
MLHGWELPSVLTQVRTDRTEHMSLTLQQRRRRRLLAIAYVLIVSALAVMVVVPTIRALPPTQA